MSDLSFSNEFTRNKPDTLLCGRSISLQSCMAPFFAPASQSAVSFDVASSVQAGRVALYQPDLRQEWTNIGSPGLVTLREC